MKNLLFISILGLGATTVAQAQDTTLRMADSLPSGHVISEVATKPWIELVMQRSGGRLKVEYFPAEQVGKAKDFLRLTQTGLVDIGYIGPAYVSEKMPLSAVAELPGASKTSCELMHSYWSMTKEGGWLYEKEYKPNGVRPLFVIALPPYQLIMARDNVKSAEDLKGKKVRAAGGAQSFALKELGMVPVRMAPPEIYNAMSLGAIDGALLAHISVDSYKLTGITRAVSQGQNFGTVVVSYAIGEKKWQALPADLKAILAKAGEDMVESACKGFDSREATAVGQLKAAGVVVMPLKEDDTAKLQQTNEKIATQWAKSLDDRGQPGSEALKQFSAALANARSALGSK